MTWQKYKVRQLGKVITGKTPSKDNPEHWGDDYPFITPTDMNGQRNASSTDRSLSLAGAAALRRLKVPAGSVSVSCIGWQMGKSIVVVEPSFTNQQLNTIIPISDIVDTYFLYYHFCSRRAELFRLASGGSRTPILRKSLFEELDVTLPPLTEQKAIAEILGSLDDKIEANRRMNETLEATARAIFKSWFVDFDPVHAKSNGEQPYGMDAETEALFPDSFEDSELGPIPRGWRVLSLDEIANYLNGLAMQKYPPEGGKWLPVIKIRELRQGFTDESSGQASVNLAPEYIIEDGDVLFSWSGSLLVDIWTGGLGGLNQHLFKVTSEDYPLWFYYFWTKRHLDEFQRIAAFKATTMGHIKRSHLKDALVAVPTEEVIRFADKVIAPLVEKIVFNRLEARTLAETRDALLPKLVSGEIRISEIENTND